MAGLGNLIVGIKNTFVNVEEPETRTERCRPRMKTVPVDFGSLLLGDSDIEDASSTVSESDQEEAFSGEEALDLQSCSSSSGGPAPSALTGRVWVLSRDAAGCREVQAALGDELGLSEQQRAALAGELHGHVLEAAVCPYANFVLQKCIVELRPEAVQFIIEEIPSEAVSSMAQNKFGCRVLQRLLERSQHWEVGFLVDAVCADLVPIAQSPYGNYVVQVLLEQPEASGLARGGPNLAALLEMHVGELGAHPFGCIVLASAMTAGRRAAGGAGGSSPRTLARAMLEQPTLLARMACTRHGHRTCLAVLDVLDGPEQEVASCLLRADPTVLANKFGRIVLGRFQ